MRLINRKNQRIGIALVFAIIMTIIIVMQTLMVFEMTAAETRSSGQFQIQSISGELESTIATGKNKAMLLAIKAEPLLQDKKALETFIHNAKTELTKEDNGSCYNLYIAGTGWDIIPDLERPEGFVATERSWYLGAKKAGGEAYVTSPYVDAWTGNICYSISVMLDDGDTVIGIDYTLDNIEAYISEMGVSGLSDAVIVTEDGIIAGYSDESFVSGKLAELLPKYEAVYSLAKNHDGVVNYKIKSSGLFYDNMFATKSLSGWYLIVSENDWSLYKKSYIQLAVSLSISVLLFGMVLVLYLSSKKNQEKAEEALASKEEFLSRITSQLREPLQVIMLRSRTENIDITDTYESNLNQIQNSSKDLSGMIEQIISYSSISRSEAENKQDTKNTVQKGIMNAKYRTSIIFLIVAVMIISVYTNINATYGWGAMKMRNEVNEYEDQLQEWIATQKSILDMFCSIISNNPQMLDDYQGTIEYLDKITKQYPEISVTYMTNPKLEHTVYMNNGWEPSDDWHVEERQWYIDTLQSPYGWNISAPYYDEQTGYYCVTISEMVFDAQTNEFLGNFGIDFYMDKLVDILGSSYTNQGYAFLVDSDGEIINHPNGSYQMSESNITNVSELEFAEIVADGQSISTIKDYDGVTKLVIASRNSESNFTIYVVSTIWTIFKNVFLYGLLSIAVFLICITIIYRMITKLLKWQDETNETLKKAADQAISAGKAKSEFLAQMSHEIRTPINAVLGMNEMILRETDKPDIREYASNIKSAGKTLLSLINSILDFSKIEDGKMEIVPVKYDTALFINDLIHAISERAKAKGLELEVIVDENLPEQMYGDDVRLKQVVMNLLTNAVKYTETGKVTATFQAQKGENEEFLFFVEIKDTGIGIKEEDMGKLFESFQRIEEKRNRNIEGTGLGMAIVIKLLAMMNSSLQVSSVYGEGSVFSFRVEQGVSGEAKVGNYQEKIAQNATRENVEKYIYATDVKVLLVDDNEMNLKVAKGLLKRNGIVPDLAVSGFEAIELVQKNSYDILFIDHMMPKMDGIETLAKMREMQLIGADSIVIALTANAISGAKERYLEVGFTDYLSKPIEVEKLERLLAKYLPESKVTYVDKKASGTSAVTIKSVEAQAPAEVASDVYTLEDLQRLHEICPEINILTGLSYCMDSREFFESILGTYLADNKLEKLNSCLETKNFEDYRIEIHALKTTSMNIGAEAMSAKAKVLEFALKEGNSDYVEAHHADVMKDYQELLEKIKKMVE